MAMRYMNEDGKLVNKQIQDGKTKRFELDGLDKAEAYARSKRSYVYNLFVETRRVAKYHCGYAVPN